MSISKPIVNLITSSRAENKVDNIMDSKFKNIFQTVQKVKQLKKVNKKAKAYNFSEKFNQAVKDLDKYEKSLPKEMNSMAKQNLEEHKYA